MAEPLRTRLIAAMAEMTNPAKSNKATVPTKSGRTYTYNYESLDQVLAAIRPPLMAHGIGLTQPMDWNEVTGCWVLRTVVFDAEERFELDERPMYPTADAQTSGSFETYMRRYALRSAFGLCGEDDDGQVATNMARENRSKAAQARSVATTPAQPKAPATAHHSSADKRKKMLARCAELSAQCIENGMNQGATDSYMTASFGVESMADLTDEQLLEFGRYLNQMEEQSRSLRKGAQQ
ncbi:ERF family protein [Olsenella sp. HMSC062G07]|uniref:ERF family protein n=1 Tax=Olsenella sp. HMSC062G07 TaxID=1739330 RepID=UPI0008A3E5D8|nr:ERF family protein [Olsenella sp. HMSC062G07]OFK25063.1 hypothetical protein HMPREF2826_00305 [Olsenella sp. HMSC062G07]